MKFSEALQAVIDSHGTKGMRLPEWQPDTCFFVSIFKDKYDGTCCPCMFMMTKHSRGQRLYMNPRYPLKETWELCDIELDGDGKRKRKQRNKPKDKIEVPPWI